MACQRGDPGGAGVGGPVWAAGVAPADQRDRFTARLSPPSWEHPFGTDDLGQDLLARMLYGGRIRWRSVSRR